MGLPPDLGLVQFIADLRNARARELEEKRINKELANIRYIPLWVGEGSILFVANLVEGIDRNSKAC